jgi:hypothetical protein
MMQPASVPHLDASGTANVRPDRLAHGIPSIPEPDAFARCAGVDSSA